MESDRPDKSSRNSRVDAAKYVGFQRNTHTHTHIPRRRSNLTRTFSKTFAAHSIPSTYLLFMDDKWAKDSLLGALKDYIFRFDSRVIEMDD